MIKFYRKIRQRLLTQNTLAWPGGKLSAYFLYALGEIVLVVIGILIALAINNRNQERVIAEKEQIYINGLQEEFRANKFKLNELIDVNQRNIQGAKQLLEYISNKSERPTEKRFSEILFNTFSRDIYFNSNNSLLNEMINSGSLKDLSNTELRIHLTNWLSILEDISKQENDLGVQREKVLDMVRASEYSIRTIFDLVDVNQQLGLSKIDSNRSNLDLLHSTEFENNILIFMLTSSATEQAHYEPLMQEINSILDLLNVAVKN